jgi:DNA-binding response OmpR family regulator
MRIIVVEDDKDIIRFLKPALESEGFLVDVSEDGEEGEFLAMTNDYDFMILDLNIPNKNGEDICRHIREKNKKFPVLILTGNQEVMTKVSLLNMGADDYMTKPFSFEELLARIKAITRRSDNIKSNILEYGNILLDKENKTVKKDNKEIYLTLKEFSLLEYLMENKGKIVSRGSIIDHVWDMKGDIFSNTIETHISNLRKKLDKDPNKIIKTLPARGYRID